MRQCIELMMASVECTRADLARLLEVSRPTVTIMLRNAQNFTLDKIEEIADKLGYDVVLTFKRRKARKK